MLLVLFTNIFFTDCCRKPTWFHILFIWEYHVQGLHHAGQFTHKYCLSQIVFETLISILCPEKQKITELSNQGTGGLREVFSPAMAIAIGLQLVAVAVAVSSYLDLTSAYGVSKSSVFASRNLFSILWIPVRKWRFHPLTEKTICMNCNIAFKSEYIWS